MSSQSSCAVRLARHSQNAWARHVECVESSRVESSRAKWNLSFSKLWILRLNDLLDGDSCKNIFYLYVFYFFWCSNMIISDALILPVSQLQTQRVMTSQI